MAHRVNAAEAASELRRLLIGGAGDGARLRVVRQFIMDVERADVPERQSLLNAVPGPIGDRRWEALLAGVVEDLALRFELPVPSWALDDDKFLAQWWFVSPFVDTHPIVFRESPAALANRGVFLTRSALENV